MDNASFIHGFFFARTLLESVLGKISHSKLRERLAQVQSGELSLIDTPEEALKAAGGEAKTDGIPRDIRQMIEEEFKRAMTASRRGADSNNIVFAKIVSDYLDALEQRFPIKKD